MLCREPTLVCARTDYSKLRGIPATRAAPSAARKSGPHHAPLSSHLGRPCRGSARSACALLLHPPSPGTCSSSLCVFRALRRLCPCPDCPPPPQSRARSLTSARLLLLRHLSESLPRPARPRGHLVTLNPLLLLYFSYHPLLLDHILHSYWFSCLSSTFFSSKLQEDRNTIHCDYCWTFPLNLRWCLAANICSNINLCAK